MHSGWRLESPIRIKSVTKGSRTNKESLHRSIARGAVAIRESPPRQIFVAGNPCAAYHRPFKRGRAHVHLAARLSLRVAHLSQEHPLHTGYSRFSGHRHRRQFRHLQRGGYAVTPSAALSASRSPRRDLVALSRARYFPRLALARPIPRSAKRKPFLRADGPRAEPPFHSHRPRAARTPRRNEITIHLAGNARRKGATRSLAVAG